MRGFRTPGWLLIAAVATAMSADAARDQRAPHEAKAAMNLPQLVGAWKRADAPRTVTAAQIFEYMDGAGELYVGYRFDHLDVWNYVSPAQGNILVELYWMKASDDAFGLLSNDWGGEPVSLAASWAHAPSVAAVPPHRALYGAGLLRIWAGSVYARLLASNETPASRAAVLDIGRSIAAGQAVAPPPSMLAALPIRLAPDGALRPDRVWFLRSHLVLNSAYFIANGNILDLDSSVEVVVAPYGPGPRGARQKPSQLVLVRYPTADAARRALEHFRGLYLPEGTKGASMSGIESPAFAKIEDGWIGYRMSGRALALVFESPSRTLAQSLIDTVVKNLGKR